MAATRPPSRSTCRRVGLECENQSRPQAGRSTFSCSAIRRRGGHARVPRSHHEGKPSSECGWRSQGPRRQRAFALSLTSSRRWPSTNLRAGWRVAMQKVVGSSPIIRSLLAKALETGPFCWARSSWPPLGDHHREVKKRRPAPLEVRGRSRRLGAMASYPVKGPATIPDLPGGAGRRAGRAGPKSQLARPARSGSAAA